MKLLKILTPLLYNTSGFVNFYKILKKLEACGQILDTRQNPVDCAPYIRNLLK